MTILREWPVRLIHALVLIWLTLILLGGRASAQPIRYDQTATTTSAQCASGKQCPVQALPGTAVNFCTTAGFATLSACLANPITTYTDSGGGTSCPPTAQLTPAIGGACLSTADNQGAFGIWFQPQTAYYYLRVPATAGGGTYGPYPFSFGVNGQASGVSYQLPATASRSITVATKLNSFYEAVADFGADPSNVETTAAAQAAISAARTANTCAHFIGGTYKVSITGSPTITNPSLTLAANACIRGDGPQQTAILLNTSGANATLAAVTGFGVRAYDLFFGKELTITGGIPLSLYPDVTASTQVAYGEFDNITINAANCQNDPTCGATANSNKLTYCVLLQSGAKDNLFNTFKNLQCRWSGEGVYLLSGGLAGSAGAGAVNANSFISPQISDVTNCFKFGASGENFVIAGQCSSASHSAALFTTGAGGTYAASASSANHFQIMGELGSTALADFTGATANVVEAAMNEDNVSTGNIVILGSQQNQNEVRAPGIAKSLFYNLASAGTSIDPGFCVGLVDDINNPCIATIDFRSTTNNTSIMRVRNYASQTDPKRDYYNLTLGSGHVYRDNIANALTVPVATFQKLFASGASSNSFARFISGTGDGNILGDANFRYVNSGATTVTEFAPGVFLDANTEVYPFTVRGNGTITYTLSGHSTNDVPCWKANNVIGYATVTAGAVSSCN